MTTVLWLLGCGPAVGDDDGGTDAQTQGVDSADTAEDPGERPEGVGVMYSSCQMAPQCDPLEFCVFPPGEPGFCAAACQADGDASVCDAAPGGGATVTCLDISLPDMREVCALDCSVGVCPVGMRCEGIETPGGARQICF